MTKKRTQVPTRIIRRGGEAFVRRFPGGETEVKVRGRFIPVVPTLRKLTTEEQRQAELGLLGQQFFRVTPEDIKRFGSAEAAIEAQRAAGVGVGIRGLERGRRIVEARPVTTPLAERRIRGGLQPTEVPTVSVKTPTPRVEPDAQLISEARSLSRSQGISADEARRLIQDAEPAVLGTAGFSPPVGESFAEMSESERRASISKAKIMRSQDTGRYNQFIRTRREEQRGVAKPSGLVSISGAAPPEEPISLIPSKPSTIKEVVGVTPRRTIEAVEVVSPITPGGIVGGLGGLGVSAAEFGAGVGAGIGEFFLGDVLRQKDLVSDIRASRIKAFETPRELLARLEEEGRAKPEIKFRPITGERFDISPEGLMRTFVKSQEILAPESQRILREEFVKEEAALRPKIPEITKQIGEIEASGAAFEIQRSRSLSLLRGVELQITHQLKDIETAPEEAIFTITEEGKPDVVKSRSEARRFFERELAETKTDIVELKARKPEVTISPEGLEKFTAFAKPLAEKFAITGTPKEAAKFLEKQEMRQRTLKAEIELGAREYYFQELSPEAYAARFVNVAGDIATLVVGGGVVVGQLPRAVTVAREAGAFGTAFVGGKFVGIKAEEVTGVPEVGAAADIGVSLVGGLGISRVARRAFERPRITPVDIKVEPEVRQFFFEVEPTRVKPRGVTITRRVKITPVETRVSASLKELGVKFPEPAKGFGLARFEAVASVGTKRAGTIFTVSGKTLSKVGEESVVSISKVKAVREFTGARKPFGRLQKLRARVLQPPKKIERVVGVKTERLIEFEAGEDIVRAEKISSAALDKATGKIVGLKGIRGFRTRLFVEQKRVRATFDVSREQLGEQIRAVSKGVTITRRFKPEAVPTRRGFRTIERPVGISLGRRVRPFEFLEKPKPKISAEPIKPVKPAEAYELKRTQANIEKIQRNIQTGISRALSEQIGEAEAVGFERVGFVSGALVTPQVLRRRVVSPIQVTSSIQAQQKAFARRAAQLQRKAQIQPTEPIVTQKPAAIQFPKIKPELRQPTLLPPIQRFEPTLAPIQAQALAQQQIPDVGRLTLKKPVFRFTEPTIPGFDVSFTPFLIPPFLLPSGRREERARIIKGFKKFGVERQIRILPLTKKGEERIIKGLIPFTRRIK